MAADSKQDLRVLTGEAFDLALHHELKRAARSQNFLTLVHLAATVAGVPGGGNGERDLAVHGIARLVSCDIRATDLLAHSAKGRLSIVLLEADLMSSMVVIDRIMARLDYYQFPRPLVFEVGAACCPTHGADLDTLRRAAESRRVHPRSDARVSASNAQAERL